MRSPEEVARDAAVPVDSCGDLDLDALTDLIRARDAEVAERARAEALADLTARAAKDRSIQGLQRAIICSWLSRQSGDVP